MSNSATSRVGFIKPDPGTGEPVDIADINFNFDKVDSVIVPQDVTDTTMPISPFANQIVRQTNTRRLFIRNVTNTAWDELLTDVKGVLINRAQAQGNPIATASTTETVIQTLPSKTYAANRAYEIRFRAQISASAIQDLTPRFRKGILNTGQLLVDYGRIQVPVSGNDRFFEFIGSFLVGAAAVTSQLCFTATTSTGTCAFKGFSTGIMETRVNVLGLDTDFPGLPALV